MNGVIVLKEKKKIALGTVIATTIGAIIWVMIAFCHRRSLADTTALALMAAVAAAWSFGAIIRIVRYLKQGKHAE